MSDIRALGHRSLARRMDATNSAEVDRGVSELAQAFDGHIDILINNAGHLVRRVPIHEMNDVHWRQVIDVNLRRNLPRHRNRLTCYAPQETDAQSVSCVLFPNVDFSPA